MTRNESSSITTSLTVLICCLVYLSAGLAFSFITADPDLWGHIKFGEQTWGLGHVSKTDTFSYTAFGEQWINHEWLTEVAFYLLYSAFDSTGLLAFKFILTLGIIHMMSQLYLSREKNLTTYLIHFYLLIPIMAPGFMTRPHLMTFLFLTIFMVIIQKYYEGKTRAIYGLPILMMIWVNCHGGVLAGMGLFGIITAVEIFRSMAKKGTHGKPLAIIYSLSWLAVMVNPYGYKLWIFFIQSLGTTRQIGEWEPISILGADKWTLKVMVIIFLISLFLPTKKRIWEIAIIIVTIIYGFKHQRHSVMIPIVMTPYLPLQITQLLKGWDIADTYKKLSRDFKITVHAVILIFIVAQVYALHDKHAVNDYKILVEPKVYPTHAAQFLIANNIDGNIMTPFDWGEYLIWKRPNSKVSVDGRFRTVYPEEILTNTINLANGQPHAKKHIKTHPPDIILLYKEEHADKIVSKLPGWGKIYDDPISQLYIKKNNPLYENSQKKQLLRPTDSPTYQFPG
jgi:hypothetical protein